VTLLKRSTSAEIIQLDKSLNTVLPEEVSDDGKQAASDLEGLRQFRFTENKTLLDSLNSDSIGSFVTFVNKTIAHQSTAEGKGITEAIVGLQSNFLLTTRNEVGEQCYHERDCVMVEIKTQQGHDCATELRVQDNKDGSYEVRYFLKDTEKCQLSVKANGEHIRGSPFNIETKPRQFRPLLSFGKGGLLSGPYGVAVNERDEILVTDTNNHRVQVFNSDGTYLRSFGKKGDEQGEFDCPSGIAHDKNKNIIVVDTNNHRVQLFSDQGEYLSQFGGKGNLDHQLTSPRGLSVDCNGNIIVAEDDQKCIKTFSSHGQFLYKLGEGEGEGEAFTAPRHCIQYNKHLIVSDSGEHCIKVFDINGDFLYKFGNKGNGDGQFNGPRFLSVNKAGHLMVCDRNNYRVQVFELSGKFVTKFPNRGYGQVVFYCPTSTAVLSDGRIVVVDWMNARIEILG
ncbi:E3 ubiquitin-protein ligase TRIM71-like, partial [Stylophora pistillata]|uniref:E3 ubiquitin-protein ligase TRIM71-like n=1 Tax=Stylophora pistillata TaxID=50429 RepID=UPI000C056263